MMSGRALLFVVVISVGIAYFCYWLYKLLLPKFNKWMYKISNKYVDYEIKEAKDTIIKEANKTVKKKK